MRASLYHQQAKSDSHSQLRLDQLSLPLEYIVINILCPAKWHWRSVLFTEHGLCCTGLILFMIFLHVIFIKYLAFILGYHSLLPLIFPDVTMFSHASHSLQKQKDVCLFLKWHTMFYLYQPQEIIQYICIHILLMFKFLKLINNNSKKGQMLMVGEIIFSK